MSHIPNSAMKHAGPVHHDDAASDSAPHHDRATSGAGAISPGAWIAIGGTLLAGAAAAIAVPLLRRSRTPVATRRGRKATVAKAKPKPRKPRKA